VVHDDQIQHRLAAVRISDRRNARLALAALAAAIALGAQLAAQAPPDFARQLQQQAVTDRAWQTAAAGAFRVQKIGYQSRADGLTIPAFVFEPLDAVEPKSRAALIWVHPDIRGHLYEYFIPYIKDAIARGYVVIAPEYRGSIGYGRELYDAIDYGGAEVDDVLTAIDYLKDRVPEADVSRLGVIGWSHGGMIALLAAAQEPGVFRAAAALVPVTNLFQRLAWKGEERQRRLIDPANRLGGPPAERHEIYKARSPVYQVDRIQIPLLVHVAANDADVNIEESMQLIDALRARKPGLAETKVYEQPKGGHLFDRQVEPGTLRAENTPEQRDSWSRVWTFLERHLN
jgi:dipeptidyl aminopeptidase/acylaminoacyl peptidase